MSFGLDWLNDLALWIGELFPRWNLLEPTHGAVKFRPRGGIKVLSPGRIYWWWPATSSVVELPIKRQTISFSQRLTTKDMVTVLCSTVVVFEVQDVQKALVDTYDFEDTVQEVAQKLVIKPIMSRDFEKTLTDMSESNEMRNEITRGARSLLSDYGVNVIDAYVSDFVETTVFSHDGEGIVMGGYDDE